MASSERLITTLYVEHCQAFAIDTLQSDSNSVVYNSLEIEDSPTPAEPLRRARRMWMLT